MYSEARRDGSMCMVRGMYVCNVCMAPRSVYKTYETTLINITSPLFFKVLEGFSIARDFNDSTRVICLCSKRALNFHKPRQTSILLEFMISAILCSVELSVCPQGDLIFVAVLLQNRIQKCLFKALRAVRQAMVRTCYFLSFGVLRGHI